MMQRIFPFLICLTFLFGPLVPNVKAAAASLQVTPTAGTFTVGSTVTLIASVSSDVAINAVSGTLSFSSDVLAITNVSQTGTILDFWTQEPTYSNSTGKISFEGVLFSPGFSGSNGKIFSVTFKTIGSGAANVTFDHGSVLANDGSGTNIVSAFRGSSFTVGSSSIPSSSTSTTTPSKATVPTAAVVTSSTHPDQTKWYASNDVDFAWDVSSDIIGVNIFGDRVVSTDPGTKPDGLFKTYTYEDVEDGQWFFHIRLQNGYGWSPTTHFAFNIDSVAPVLSGIDVEDASGENGTQISVTAVATDALSGVDYLVIQIDDGEKLIVSQSELTPDQPMHIPTNSGDHVVKLIVVDLAGNTTEQSVPVSVQAVEIPSSVVESMVYDPPVIGFPSMWQAWLSSPLALLVVILCALVICLLFLFVFASITRYRHGFVQVDVKKASDQFHEAFATVRKDLEIVIAKSGKKGKTIKPHPLQKSLDHVESIIDKELLRISKKRL